MNDKNTDELEEISTLISSKKEEQCINIEISDVSRLKERLDIVDGTLETVSHELSDIKEVVKSEVRENKYQARLLAKLIKNNKRGVNSLMFIVIGGITSVVFLMMRLDLQSEYGKEAYERLENRIFEFLTITVAGGSGILAFNEHQKGKNSLDEDILDEEETEEILEEESKDE